MTMKKIISAAILAAITLVSCQQSLEDKCAKEAEDFTRKKCPSRIDEFIMIDSMTFDKTTHTLSYWYHVTGQADRSEVFNDPNMKKALVDKMKNSTTMQVYKDAGYNFRFVYRSEDSKTIYLDTTVGEKDYK